MNKSVFSIGSIRTSRTLDLESKSHYWLTLCAQDQAVVPLYSCVQVYISVLNENDNVPLTQSAVYYPSVPESSPSGVKVIQLVAEDRDDDPEQRLTYRITSGNPEGFFAINSTSGKSLYPAHIHICHTQHNKQTHNKPTMST